MTPQELLAFAKKNDVLMVDLRFIDLPGIWQHFSMPLHQLTLDIFEEGIGFDGSSIRGFQGIQESDMLLMPDPTYSFMDPFTKVKTLNLICNVKDPVTGERYHKDPRYVAQKGESVTPFISALKRSFLFLMMFVLNRIKAQVSIR